MKHNRQKENNAEAVEFPQILASITSQYLCKLHNYHFYRVKDLIELTLGLALNS